MKQPAPRMARLRLWWLLHGETMGLPILGVLGFALFVLAAFATVPTGPSTTVDGTVVGFGVAESDLGTRTRIRVRVGEVVLNMPMTPGSSCRVGDEMKLRRMPKLWGPAFAPGSCRRPPG